MPFVNGHYVDPRRVKAREDRRTRRAALAALRDRVKSAITGAGLPIAVRVPREDTRHTPKTFYGPGYIVRLRERFNDVAVYHPAYMGRDVDPLARAFDALKGAGLPVSYDLGYNATILTVKEHHDR